MTTSGILVTGGRGQLATALRRLRGSQVRLVGRPDFDFDRPDTVDALFASRVPRLIVNAAAWTAVDLAEQHPEAAWRANCDGPARLARLCAARGVELVHVSTDYVFDGLKGAPYVEEDAPSPTGVYGSSKRAGEKAILDALPGATILRTAWVYSPTGKNFARTILAAAQRQTELRVVADQIGCPTTAAVLAEAVMAVAEARLARPSGSQSGIFHAACQGSTSWHGFAAALLENASRLGWAVPPLRPIATADWPTPARRPPDSRLDSTKLMRVFGHSMPLWQDRVADVVRCILLGETIDERKSAANATNEPRTET